MPTTMAARELAVVDTEIAVLRAISLLAWYD